MPENENASLKDLEDQRSCLNSSIIISAATINILVKLYLLETILALLFHEIGKKTISANAYQVLAALPVASVGVGGMIYCVVMASKDAPIRNSKAYWLLMESFLMLLTIIISAILISNNNLDRAMVLIAGIIITILNCPLSFLLLNSLEKCLAVSTSPRIHNIESQVYEGDILLNNAPRGQYSSAELLDVVGINGGRISLENDLRAISLASGTEVNRERDMDLV